MNTLSFNIIIFLFGCFSIGGAQLEWDDDLLPETYNCQHISDTDCDELDKSEKCLKNVILQIERQRKRVQQQLNQIDRQRTSCSGLNTNEDCEKCTDTIYTLDKEDNKEACNLISEAKDCLTNKLAACTRPSNDWETIDDIEEKCNYGHYDHCTPEKLNNCTLPVSLDYKVINPLDFPAGYHYKCDTVKVTAAFDCLDKLKHKCPKQEDQEDIKESWTYLNTLCPYKRSKIQE